MSLSTCREAFWHPPCRGRGGPSPRSATPVSKCARCPALHVVRLEPDSAIKGPGSCDDHRMKEASAGPRLNGSVRQEIRIVFRLVPVHVTLAVRAGGSATGLSATDARMSLPAVIEPCAPKTESARAKIDHPAPSRSRCVTLPFGEMALASCGLQTCRAAGCFRELHGHARPSCAMARCARHVAVSCCRDEKHG